MPTPEEIAAATKVLTDAKVPAAAIKAVEGDPDALVSWALSLIPDEQPASQTPGLSPEFEKRLAELEKRAAPPPAAPARKGEAANAEIESLKATVQALVGIVEGQVTRSVKDRLGPKYPGISDQKGWDRVRNVAGALVQSGEATDIDSAFDRAAAFVFPTTEEKGSAGVTPKVSEQDAEVETAAARLKRLRAAGSPTPAVQTTVTPSLSADEAETRIGMLITQGRKAEAQKVSDQYKATVGPFFG